MRMRHTLQIVIFGLGLVLAQVSCGGNNSDAPAKDAKGAKAAGADATVSQDTLQDPGSPTPSDAGGGNDVRTDSSTPSDQQGGGDAWEEDILDIMGFDTGGQDIQETCASDEWVWDSGPEGGGGEGGSWDWTGGEGGGWEGWGAEVVLWDGYNWEGGGWDGYNWEGGGWDGYNWDGFHWDGYNWDGVDWDGYNWGDINWDGISWDGIDFDFGPMPETTGEDCGDIDEVGVCEGDVVKYCLVGEVYEEDCSDSGAGCTCGYLEDLGWYDCVGDCW